MARVLDGAREDRRLDMEEREARGSLGDYLTVDGGGGWSLQVSYGGRSIDIEGGSLDDRQEFDDSLRSALAALWRGWS